MSGPTDDANVVSRLDEAVARIDHLETLVANLTESVNTAVGTMMPKVEALLSRSRHEVGPTSSGSASSVDPTPSTSLLEMAERGDGEGIFQIVAERHIDIGNLQRTESGDTALHVAASRGHLKAVIVLLGAGVNVDTLGHCVRTPLHCAAAHGHLRVAQRLLDAGAQIDAKDASGATGLELAIKEGHWNMVEQFLEKGLSAISCNVEGHTLLVEAAKARQWGIVELLVKRGTSATNINGGKALDLAVEEGNWNVVAMLLQKGAQISSETLCKIESEAQCNLVELLLLNGVSADLCDEEGDTLLVQAARAGRWIMVQQLLKRGASATKCNNWPVECALRYAANGGRADVVRLLLRHGAASVSEQIEYGLKHATSAAVVWAFVDVVPDAVRGEAGRCGLVEAACKGRLEPLVALLEAGVDVDAKDVWKQTALYLAAANGRVACVRELLRRGADVNAKDRNGDTPLHRAYRNGKVECVGALLAVGASTTEKNKKGKTPLEVATSDAVRQLLNATTDQS